MKDATVVQPQGAVLCVGRVYCDLIFTGVPSDPVPGREVFAKGLSLHAGGGAAITAGWLSALGRRAELSAYLPAAPFDGPVLRDLAAASVGTELCAKSRCTEPQLTVAIVRDDDRAFLTRAPGPAAPILTGTELRRFGVTHLHIGELRTLIDRPDLIDLARQAGATLSSDCGWDDTLEASCAPLIAALDVFMPNEVEAARLDTLGLPQCPAPLTVVKRGPLGAEVRQNGGLLEKTAPEVQVVDSTGAGDAFAAGFLLRWLDGAGVEAALQNGVLCGAQAVTQPGGLSARPDRMPA
ncbi:carbohydrate kinase family protein [Aestuariibius sp. 2305UL40-4]|uniref:carbohydrate kinase family protein n=1 Tax=Aestuariibius violaceus TaxID=3234132 RepID=UPI00345E33F3